MRRLLGVGATVAAVLALFAAPTPARPQTEPPVTFSFFSANSSADGIRIYFDVVGFMPVSPALSLGNVTAEGFVESSRRTASALLPDPGGVIVATPGLAAGLVGVPNVPGYPLVARADDPFTPHSEASPILGTGAGVIRADAGPRSAAATARLAGAGAGDGLLGLAPLNELVASLVDGAELPVAGRLVEVSGAEAHVEESQPSPTRLDAKATSRLSGVRLLGGLVQIASIETTVSVELDGATATAKPPVVTVAGVTVAGIPARIGERGLTLAGSDAPLAELLVPLADPLVDEGVSLRLGPSSAGASGATAQALGGGVVLEVTSSYRGYPVVLRIVFGEARAVVQASVRAASAGSDGPVDPDLSPPLLEPSRGDLPSLTVTPPVIPPGGSGGPTGDPGGGVQVIAERLDLRSLYPWLAVLAGLVAASRWLAFWRLRRDAGACAAVHELYRW